MSHKYVYLPEGILKGEICYERLPSKIIIDTFFP